MAVWLRGGGGAAVATWWWRRGGAAVAATWRGVEGEVRAVRPTRDHAWAWLGGRANQPALAKSGDGVLFFLDAAAAGAMTSMQLRKRPRAATDAADTNDAVDAAASSTPSASPSPDRDDESSPPPTDPVHALVSMVQSLPETENARRYYGPRAPIRPADAELLARDREIRAYLCCRPGDALPHLRPVVRWLVATQGGVRSCGSLLAQDDETGVWVSVVWPKDTSTLPALVEATAAPAEEGGQGSHALVRLLERVARALHTLVCAQADILRATSGPRRLEVGEGDEAEEVGARWLSATDERGAAIHYTNNGFQTNRQRAQPSCATAPWLLEMAMRPDALDSTVFDALDGAVRSGSHVVVASPNPAGAGHSLSLRQLQPSDHVLLDAGHDLGELGLPPELPADALAALPEVAEARAAVAEWLGEHADFFLVSIAERLLLRVRKEAHVFEACSDRGKTALLTWLLAALGTYARRMPNNALEGENRRTAPIAEMTLSRAGVRFLLHDEADRVDWEYLKQQSNAAAGEEWGAGMGATLSAAHKATRIVTRNATRVAATVLAAPQDCRRKIVHWTSDTIHKPRHNPARFARIERKDPVLARGLFLAVMEAFQRLQGQRTPDIPVALVAGADLCPTPPAAQGSAVARQGVDTAMETITLAARGVFHELFRPSMREEGGTTAADVAKAVTADARLPEMCRALSRCSGVAFVKHVLQAGANVTGDGVGVPACVRSCPQSADGVGREARTANVLACLRRT